MSIIQSTVSMKNVFVIYVQPRPQIKLSTSAVVELLELRRRAANKGWFIVYPVNISASARPDHIKT